jgi:hypothetical protein
MGWCLNPDERIDLGEALNRATVGNLPVFHAALLTDISICIQHMEDMESFSSPIYQVVAVMECMAPIVISGRVGQITGVKTQVSAVL